MKASSGTTSADPAPLRAQRSVAGSRQGVYVVSLLAVISMLSQADRNILAVLLVPIQQDLQVSDTAMGALTGISFTLVYATVAPVSVISPAMGLDVVRPRARGAMTALMGFSASVIGGGLGPLVLGAINDAVARTHGDGALRYSLQVVPICLLLAAACLAWASRFADQDNAALRLQP